MAAIARRIALSVLSSLHESNIPLDHRLTQAFEKRRSLLQRDRALATELVLGVLRWRGRLDWIIHHLSKTPIHKMDPLVLDIIRLGLYQILFLSRIPISAAVNDSVELAKEKAPFWVVRFVNAVLRSAEGRAKEIPLPTDSDDPVSAIAIGESHPCWMVERWLKRMGIEETRRLCKANNQIPPVTARVNTLKVSREKLFRSLTGHVNKVRQTRFSPDGLALRGLKRAIADMPAFQEGWFQVQDEAAQLVSYLLGPRPGETILDACAGRGGKTGHIAQLMKDSGVIKAMDHQAWKLQALEASMRRLGVSNVTTWHHNLSEPVAEDVAGTFDRVLVDAPCSGLGVVRRRPDIKWRKQEEDLARLQKKQGDLLACLAPLVKGGGCLAYSVCSLEPDEGERVVEGFLKSRTEFVIDCSSTGIAEMDEHLVDGSGIFRSLPHKHDMDGFFAVRLKKIVA